jgi:hypothetical protein
VTHAAAYLIVMVVKIVMIVDDFRVLPPLRNAYLPRLKCYDVHHSLMRTKSWGFLGFLETPSTATQRAWPQN